MNSEYIDETYDKKTDTVTNAVNAEKVNDLGIVVDENGVLGYLPEATGSSDQRVVIPQRKLVWEGRTKATSDADAQLLVAIQLYRQIEIVFESGSASGRDLQTNRITCIASDFKKGYLYTIGFSGKIYFEWIEIGYDVHSEKLNVSGIKYATGDGSEGSSTEDITVQKIYKIIE